MPLIGVPGDAAAEMGANIGEDPHITLISPYHIQTVISCSPLSAIDSSSRKFNLSRNTNGIIFKQAKIDD